MHIIIELYKTSSDRVEPNAMKRRRAEILDHPTADPLNQVFAKTAGEKALDAERRQGR